MAAGKQVAPRAAPSAGHPAWRPGSWCASQRWGGAGGCQMGGAAPPHLPSSLLPPACSLQNLMLGGVCVRTRVESDKGSQVFLSRLSGNHKNGVCKRSCQWPGLPRLGRAGLGQQLRGLARPAHQLPGQGVKCPSPPQVSRLGIALPFACLSPLCSPSSQALLGCQLGLLPPHSCLFTSGARRESWSSPQGVGLTAACLAFSERVPALRF